MSTSVLGGWRQNPFLIGLQMTIVCLIAHADRSNLAAAIIPMAEEFGWKVSVEGVILSSYLYGYICVQIVGGVLAEMFGGQHVLSAGLLVWSITTALTPPAARAGVALLLLVRTVMGLGEGVLYSSLHSLIAHAVPARWQSTVGAAVNNASAFGVLLGYGVTPPIIAAWGWPYAFYFFAAVGLVWLPTWLLLRFDDTPDFVAMKYAASLRAKQKKSGRRRPLVREFDDHNASRFESTDLGSSEINDSTKKRGYYATALSSETAAGDEEDDSLFNGSGDGTLIEAAFVTYNSDESISPTAVVAGSSVPSAESILTEALNAKRGGQNSDGRKSTPTSPSRRNVHGLDLADCTDLSLGGADHSLSVDRGVSVRHIAYNRSGAEPEQIRVATTSTAEGRDSTISQTPDLPDYTKDNINDDDNSINRNEKYNHDKEKQQLPKTGVSRMIYEEPVLVACEGGGMLEGGRRKTGEGLSWSQLLALVTALFQRRAVWAIILGQIGCSWMFFTLTSWLPTLIKEVYIIPYNTLYLYICPPYLAHGVIGLASGFLADYLIFKKNWSRWTTRQFFQFLSAAPPAFLIPGGLYFATTAGEFAVFLTIAWAFFSLRGVGVLVSQQDIAPDHAGIVFGIGNTASVLAGMLGTFVTGLLREVYGSWAQPLWLGGFILLLGDLGFLLCASGEPLALPEVRYRTVAQPKAPPQSSTTPVVVETSS